jgi:phage-related holin
MAGELKSILLKSLFAVAVVFAPAKAAVATVLVLILADLVTGLLAARKKKHSITSSGLKRSITKLFVYETAIILSFLTETYLLDGTLPLMKIVTGYIGITEFLSVMENLNVISNGTLIKQLLAKLNVDSSKSEVVTHEVSKSETDNK